MREKGYRNLKNITPGYFGYSVLRSSVLAELYHELLDTCQKMDMAIEGLHTETGPGVIEAAIAVDDALRAADKAVLFKTFAKAMTQRRGLMATFMAKWSNQYPGQSGHIHTSLRRTDGGSAFFEEGAPHYMSETMRHFLGGQQKLMPEMLSAATGVVQANPRWFTYWVRGRRIHSSAPD